MAIYVLRPLSQRQYAWHDGEIGDDKHHLKAAYGRVSTDHIFVLSSRDDSFSANVTGISSSSCPKAIDDGH